MQQQPQINPNSIHILQNQKAKKSIIGSQYLQTDVADRLILYGQANQIKKHQMIIDA